MVHTAWSSAGRALHVSGVRGQAMTNYFASAAAPALYAAHGALREAQWGNGLWERWEYLPERLQAWRVQVGSATQASSKGEWQFGYCAGSWGLSCASNNGNIVGQKILPANVTQVYSFDALNRISAATESGGVWLETYGFDVHGNLWWNSRSASLGGPHLMRPDGAAWFANGRNRAVKPGELESESFDAAGNLKKAGVLGLEYDGENRLAKATGSGSTVYGYDGLGRRVMKQEAGGTLTYYVYDAFGGLAAEYLPTGPDSTVGTHYLGTDHLGSTRLVTDQAGEVVSRHDYLPFGEEIPNTVGSRQSVAGYAWNGSLTQRFTGKERDGETGLDYFGARYLSGAMGRFTGADPLLNSGRPWMPQSWNRYAYTLNNPLRFTDPTGLYEWGACSGTDKECDSYKKRFKDSLSYLKTARDSFDKKSREYKRLDSALKAYGKEGERNGVSVGFGDLGGTAAGRMTPGGDMKSFSVIFDPAKMSKTDGAKWMAIDSGHEGTHVDDFKWMFAGAAQLSEFSVEYRGHESFAFVFQGLFTPNPLASQGTVIGGVSSRDLGYSGNVIWNTSWGAADKAALQSRDSGITNTVIQRYGHAETKPHNPWGN